MTTALDTAAKDIAKLHQDMTDYIRTSTWLIGLLPILYGAMTWVFGDALWLDSPVYRTALSVPYAPQSWGTTFIFLGVASILTAELRNHRLDAVCCIATAVILASFMTAFMSEVVGSKMVAALPHAAIYALFSLLYMNRARLAWQFRNKRR